MVNEIAQTSLYGTTSLTCASPDGAAYDAAGPRGLSSDLLLGDELLLLIGP